MFRLPRRWLHALCTSSVLILAHPSTAASTAPNVFWLGLQADVIEPDFDPNSQCRRHCDQAERLASIQFWQNTRLGVVEAQPALANTEANRRAARFLMQATYGPTAQSVQELGAAIAAEGELSALSRWLDQQMAEPTTRLADKVSQKTHGLSTSAWWQQSLSAPDQLRQRVAFALNHVMTVSRTGALKKERTLADYYDTLADHAFANHRDLIEAITWHIGMGVWLDNLRNSARTGQANENYARELMQLFTLGTERLAEDGSVLTDNGQALEAYTEADVVALAKALSGMKRGGQWMGAAKLRERHHFKGEKALFSGTPQATTLDNKRALEDIQQALDTLHAHPNVGPFLALRLIQHLVTSNPSPAYIARVVAVFNGEQGTPRGDLGAMIKAILLDPEARAWPDEAAGPTALRLKAPVLRLTNLYRAFAVDPHSRMAQRLRGTQTPLSAPTVFSWFQADDVLPEEVGDTVLKAPEFQLTKANDLARYHNAIVQSVLQQRIGRRALRQGAFNRLLLSQEAALAEADPAALIERYNLLLMGGTMPSAMQATLLQYLQSQTEQSSEQSAREVLYLVMTSTQHAVQH